MKYIWFPRGASSLRGHGWMTPVMDGKALTISLPARIDRFPTERENFDWYKVVLTHQAGHFEFGTFDFKFDRPSTCFATGARGSHKTPRAQNVASDRQRFLQCFPISNSAGLIFDRVEDARVNARMLEVYPGIRPLYGRVARNVLASRPRLRLLPLREAFLEALVQMSLSTDPTQDLPEFAQGGCRSGHGLFRKSKTTGAAVEDSAEAALRLYEIAARLPNSPMDNRDDDQ